jgi:hypothetical protein
MEIMIILLYVITIIVICIVIVGLFKYIHRERFRIKHEGSLYIPQVYENCDWNGIDRESFTTWGLETFQQSNCAVDSYDKAYERIELYKRRKQVGKPKYYKVD